jgi:hypothetical protein
VSAITSAAGRVGSRAWAVPAAVYAAAVGYLAVTAPRHAVAVAGAPFVVLLMLNPWWAAAAAVWLLPVQNSVGAGGVQVAGSDVMLLACFAGLVPLVAMTPAYRDRLLVLRPVLPWMAPFLIWLVVLVLVHPSQHALVNSVQYAELTGFAVVVGAVVLTPATVRAAMTGFLVVACITAALWTARSGSFSVDNKNPAGQFMVDAMLLSLIVVRTWRWRAPIVLLLILGILHTESRGAVLGAGLGGLVLLAFRGLGTWRRTAAAIVPLVLACIVGYNVVPNSLQARVRSTFSADKLPAGVSASNVLPGDLPSSQYTVQLRTIYRREGITFVRQHPIFGVGVGNYLTGDAGDNTLTNDPHDVLLLDAGEGGVPDLALFLLMFAGTGIVMVRRRRLSPWAGPALALQAAILTHGLVDVYWVRGTPVMGWLLVGMALNPLLDRKPEVDEAAAPVDAAPVRQALPAPA